MLDQAIPNPPPGYSAYLSRFGDAGASPFAVLPETLGHLDDGDIVRISPTTGTLAVLYRRNSSFNSIFVTERCNSNCIMCSQPPKAIDDGFRIDEYLAAIPLMSPDTRELGITGGEPTLLRERLFELICHCKHYLPQTALHMLSNGRMFNYLQFCRQLAEIQHSDLMIGIPLYSDLAADHDFVVQAVGAFDQTIRGMMNLARFDQRVEVRVVIHRHTVPRLRHLAEFIALNLPFVDQVALMGLEMMGYVKMNLPSLWIDPVDYQAELCEAVQALDTRNVRVMVYNHQLCVLDRSLWPFACKSISDWKNEYLAECDRCAVRQQCGGFFSSAKLRYSDHIQAITEEAVSITA